MSDSADFTETPVSSKVVFDGALLKVIEDTVRLPDGKHTIREYIRHPGACMMIAFLDERTLLMERQYRYPLHRHFIELPAGKRLSLARDAAGRLSFEIR